MCGCVVGTGLAVELGAEGGVGGVGVVVEIGKVLEFGADTEPVNTPEPEAGVQDGNMAGAEVELLPEPTSGAGLDFAAFGCETYRILSSEAVAVRSSGVSPRAGFVFASAAEHMMAPCGSIQGAPPEVLTGAQPGATAVEPELLDKTVDSDLLAGGMVGELDASAGRQLGFVTLVWVSTAGKEPDPESPPHAVL